MLGLGTAIVTSGTVLDSALLDDFGGAAVGYSVRRLNGDYYGPCMRVRRDSDNAERDIYFGVDDVLDTATLEDFCDGTDGYVVRWYNQTESYESLKLLNQSYASSPEAAYSVRQLDNDYDGPCMEVASSDDVIGFRMTADQVDSGNLAIAYNDDSAYSGGATVFTGEIYVDAPSHITANKNVRFRMQMIKAGGVALSNYGVVNVLNHKKWLKVKWTLNAVPIQNGFSLIHDRNVGTEFLKGEQVLFRNIEATGYTAVYDEDDYSISNFADETEVIKGYNIPFTAGGDLDEAKIVEHGYASPFECLEIDVADTTDATGNYQIVIPGADTIDGDPSASGTYTVTTEIYVDCPSISGAVSFKGQIGTGTKNFTEGNTVAQKQWVTRTMSGTVASEGQESARIYFAGTAQAAQELEEGDKIYFRRVILNHSEDSTYNAELDFTSSAEGVTYAFPSGGDGDATLSHGKAPAEELNVTTWYDQSGNGNDATQTTFANTPSVYQYNSTTKDYRVVKENGAASVQFAEGTGTPKSLVTLNNVDLQEYQCWSMVTKFQDDGASRTAYWWQHASGSNTAYFGQLNSANNIYYGGNVSSNEFITSTNYGLTDDELDSIIFYKSGDNVFLQINNDSNDQNIDDGAEQMKIDSTRKIRIGANSGGGQPFTGTMSEIVLLNTDIGSHIDDLKSNLKSYFKISDDLDATQSDDAKQPQVVDNGSTVTEGGQPALSESDSTASELNVSSLDYSDLHTSNECAALQVVSGSGQIVFGLGGNTEFGIISGWSDGTRLFNAPTTNSASGLSTGQSLVFGNRSGDTKTINENGVGTLSVNDSANFPTGSVVMKNRMRFTAKLQETIWWNSDQKDNISGIEDNINEFYSIY